MIQKCSYLQVLEIFFSEPVSVHFIREIGKKISLSPTSVRKHVKDLLKENLIKKQKASPFDGFIANRENDDFVFYKRLYNIYSLKDLVSLLSSAYYPKAIIVFGSYSRGEDVETSDIDVVIITKTKKNPDLAKHEHTLKRKIHIMEVESVEKLEENIIKKVSNGIVLYGGI